MRVSLVWSGFGNAGFDKIGVGVAHPFLEDMAEQPVAKVRGLRTSSRYREGE